MANTKANAEELCKIAGGTLGEIVSFRKASPRYELWMGYYDSYEEALSINVSFQLK